MAQIKYKKKVNHRKNNDQDQHGKCFGNFFFKLNFIQFNFCFNITDQCINDVLDSKDIREPLVISHFYKYYLFQFNMNLKIIKTTIRLYDLDSLFSKMKIQFIDHRTFRRRHNVQVYHSINSFVHQSNSPTSLRIIHADIMIFTNKFVL